MNVNVLEYKSKQFAKTTGGLNIMPEAVEHSLLEKNSNSEYKEYKDSRICLIK